MGRETEVATNDCKRSLQDIVWRSTVDTLPDIVPEGFVQTLDSRADGPHADSLKQGEYGVEGTQSRGACYRCVTRETVFVRGFAAF